MNSLYAALPTAVETGGVRYAINADYRTALRIFAALEDTALAELEKQAVMLRLFYCDAVPPNAAEAVRLAVKFLNCGQEPENAALAPPGQGTQQHTVHPVRGGTADPHPVKSDSAGKPAAGGDPVNRGESRNSQTRPAAQSPESGPRLYSFTADAPLIYAAMCRTYGEQVLAGALHWYRFAALFADIDGDTLFARLLYLRRGRQAGTLTPQERRVAAALGHYMDVPDTGRRGSAPQGAEAAEFFRAYRNGKDQL